MPYLNPLVLETSVSRKGRVTTGGEGTLVAHIESAGVLNPHVALEGPAVHGHKVAQVAGEPHVVLLPRVLVQAQLGPEGLLAVLARVLPQVSPDGVPAQLVRRSCLKLTPR